MDPQAAGTLAAQLGADPVLMPEMGYKCRENPRNVGSGPEVILCSGELEVTALEEPSTPSCGPASFSGQEAGKSQEKSGPVGKQGWSTARETKALLCHSWVSISPADTDVQNLVSPSGPPLPTSPLIQA